MAKLYVPVISSDSDLYEIKVTGHENAIISINGILKGAPGFKEIEPLAEKLQTTFTDGLNCLVKIRSKERNLKFNSFSSSTTSINLGIFTALYAYQNKRTYSHKYDSITVTGDFDIENSSVSLLPVNKILEKYEIAKRNAEANPDAKHLFLYVCDQEQKPVKDGWDENLFVVGLSSSDRIECVFAEIFDLTEWQEKILKSVVEDRYNVGYVETSLFIKWKRDIILDSDGGIIIQGNSNTGKSIAAASLYKYLFVTGTVEELVWITIYDNRHFWNEITKLSGSEICLSKNEIIRSQFSESFDSLENLLQAGKKTCLVIDNIEGDFVDVILSFLEDSYKRYVDGADDNRGLLKIIITSWKNAKDKTLVNSLCLKEGDAQKLEVSRFEFNQIFYGVLNSLRDSSVFYGSSVELKERFMSLIYEQCFEGDVIFPGYINLALAPLHGISLVELLKKYERGDIKLLSPKKKFIRVDFEILDIVSQMVLLAFIGINNYWKELDYTHISRILNESLFNAAVVGANFISEANIENSVNKLVKTNLLQTKDNKVFIAKNDVIEYCVYSKSANEEIDARLEKVRNFLIPPDVKIEYAVQNDFFSEYTDLLKQFNDEDEINRLFIHCIQFNRGLDYLRPLVDKGINPEYEDKDQQTAIDVLWCQQPEMEVLDYLLEKGFKPRSKIPCHDRSGNSFLYSPLLFAVNRCYAPLVRKIIEMHLFDDINEYEFRGKWTALQLYTAIGSNVEIVDLLVHAGADPGLKTKDDASLLTCAALNINHPEILEYLIENNICTDFDYKDKTGKTALDYAKKIGNKLGIKLLER